MADDADSKSVVREDVRETRINARFFTILGGLYDEDSAVTTVESFLYERGKKL